MMNAKEAIAKAQALGVTLTVRDGMIYPSGATSPEARALLWGMRPLKQAIIDEVERRETQALIDAATQQHDAALSPEPATSDLTHFVGAIVRSDTLNVLQGRCVALGWTLHTLPADDKWYITGMSAKREMGKIIAGGKPEEGHYHYAIKPWTPLYHRTTDSKAHNQWLWPKMQDDTGDADVLAALYTIINGAWVGCDVYVDGPNADVVMAAAAYLLNQYRDKTLPIWGGVRKAEGS